MLALLVVGAFIVVGMLTIDPMFRLLGADETTLPLVRQYMTIWYPGMIFVVVPMVGNNAIRATGDTKTPSFIMLAAVAINIVMDPILIFGLGPFPAMGIQGAAIATVLSRATTLVIAIWVLYHRENMITLRRPALPGSVDLMGPAGIHRRSCCGYQYGHAVGLGHHHGHGRQLWSGSSGGFGRSHTRGAVRPGHHRRARLGARAVYRPELGRWSVEPCERRSSSQPALLHGVGRAGVCVAAGRSGAAGVTLQR